MTPEFVISLAKDAIQTVLLVSAPVLIISMTVGLAVSIFQTATQINEQTLTFVPKIVAVFITGIMFSSWMLGIMVDFITGIFLKIPNIVP